MDSDKKFYPKAEKEKNQHIQVVVRLRPMNQSEKRQGGVNLVSAVHDKREVIVKEKVSTATRTFTFDKVFGPNSKQYDVYKEVVMPIMDEVLMGYNCTIFAYGQTGTGKTFTMEGERSNEPGLSWENDPLAGIIPRTLHQLFERLSEQQADFTVRASFVELYNEELFDLMTGVEDTKRLRLFDDPVRKGSVVIHGLEEVIIRTKEEVYDIIERGARKRQTAATLLNAQSSRSHSVFSVTVHIREMTLDGEELLKTGKLYLVDLAGSENIGRSGAVDKRAREAGNINQSLLTLGRVITALVEHAPHVPYRESKLTRLLQDSLGGKTKTSIIATISPASICLEETLSTLDYAFRAKNITNRPEVNQKLTKKAIMKEYAEEIERLRRDLQATREKHGIYIAEENYVAMQKQMTQQSDEISELMIKIEMMQQEYSKLNDMFADSQEKFEKTTKRLAATTDKYMQTRQVLGDTTKQLVEKRNEVDEKAFLLQAHAEKEKMLRSQAETLVDISKRATTNLSHLHNKLEKKDAVEQKNFMTLHQFHNFLASQINGMDTNIDRLIADFKTSHSKQKAENDERLKQGHCKLAEAITTMDNLQRDFDNSKTLLEKSLNDQLKLRLSNYETDAERIKFITALVTEEVAKFHESSLGNNVSKTTQTLSQLGKTAESFKASYHEENSETQKMIQNFGTTIKTDLNQFKRILSLKRLKQNETFDVIRQKVDSAAQDQAMMLEKIQQAQQLLLDVGRNQKKLLEETLPDVTSLSNQYVEEEASISGLFNNQVSQLEAKCDAAKSSTIKSCEIRKEANQELFVSFEKSHSSAVDQMNQIKEQSETFVSNFSKTVESHKNEFISRQSQHIQNEREALNGNHTTIVKMATTNSCNVKHSNGALKRSVAEMDTYIETDHSDKMADLAKLENWCSKQSNTNADLLLNADTLLSQKIARYKPTGDTPVRQQFNIPAALVEVSPHESLIKRFRQDNPPIEFEGLSDDDLENHDMD